MPIERDRASLDETRSEYAQDRDFPGDVPSQPLRVVVTDFDMRFWSLVRITVKSAIAAIPAMVILSLIGFGLFVLLGIFGVLI